MRLFRTLRWLLPALLICLIPSSSFAGVFISVGFAPPVLPMYEQPPCPEPGLMWTPGYWAYDEDGYYWVPGTWVPVPYEGALWTPPYWGWEGGLYIFHPGYWGRHVGYYGGVNYGFGYMGIGFVGGMWRGHDFVYNRAVMRVDERYVHTTYIDRTIVERNTIVNDRRVAFSGGRDGIHHDPLPEERFADRDRHMEPTSFQHQHESAAMSDRSLYVRNNGGRPSNPAVTRPLGMGNQGAPGADRNRPGRDAWNGPGRADQNQGGGSNQDRGNYNRPNGGNSGGRADNNPRPGYGGGQSPGGNGPQFGNGNDRNPNSGSMPPNNSSPDARGFNNPRNNSGSAPYHSAPEFRQQPRSEPQVRQMPQPQPRPELQLQARPQPQMRQAPPQQQQPHPESQQHDRGRQPDHRDPKDHEH